MPPAVLRRPIRQSVLHDSFMHDVCQVLRAALPVGEGDLALYGAGIGVTAVLHTWGQNLSHHPHVHCIVPGGGLSPDGSRWVSCRPGFFLPVRVLSRLFRRLFLEGLAALHAAGDLQFFGDFASLADAPTFRSHLAPLAKTEWVVFAKQPFAGPEEVIRHFARYTHRVAIGNSRLVDVDDRHVTFRWKDYRETGNGQSKVMRLSPAEFMRRFLLHVLPDGFHRIRHYGLFANGHRAEKLAHCRKVMGVPAAAPAPDQPDATEARAEQDEPPGCPCCGGRMRVIETFEPGASPRIHPVAAIRIDSS